MTSLRNDLSTRVENAAGFLKLSKSPFPGTAIIIGSGLGGFVERIEIEKQIPYENIPNFPGSSVAGHSGKLMFSTVSGEAVVLMAGRKHLYEGISAREAVLPVRALAESGIKILILTNAAGGLNPYFKPGDLMLITDHLNLTFRNPLAGPYIEKWGPRFPDMSSPYDETLMNLARQTALENSIPLMEGVYAAGTGPTYETRAEVNYLKTAGADAVGMSTVPENIAARQMNLRVLGISFISNSLVSDPSVVTSHEEVLENARLVEDKFADLLTGILGKIRKEIPTGDMNK